MTRKGIMGALFGVTLMVMILGASASAPGPSPPQDPAFNATTQCTTETPAMVFSRGTAMFAVNLEKPAPIMEVMTVSVHRASGITLAYELIVKSCAPTVMIAKIYRYNDMVNAPHSEGERLLRFVPQRC